MKQLDHDFKEEVTTKLDAIMETISVLPELRLDVKYLMRKMDHIDDRLRVVERTR